MSRAELNKPAANFTLADFSGQEISLASFQGKKNILLVFNRGFV
jgi:peroxiredoxin